MSGAMTPPPGLGAAAGGAPPPDPTAGADAGGDDTVVCTISKTADGSYMVYQGDEPDSGGGDDSDDMSADDADAMGPGGDMPGGGAGPPSQQGTPADSIGAALKAAMDVLQADKGSEGAPGNADDQLSAGFGASKSPTPVGMGGGA